MSHDEVRKLFLDHRMVAVLRTDDPELAESAGRAVIAGGARIVEVTWTVPDAARVVAMLRAGAPDGVTIGVGTIISEADLDAAMQAGAEFIISPDVNLEMIRLCAERQILHIPGAMTPTEILAAHRAGATLVKVFPVASLGGVSHIRAVRGPIPSVPLLVTGGVDLDNIEEFFAAGATVVGLSNTLLLPEHLASGAFDEITALTRLYLDKLDNLPPGS